MFVTCHITSGRVFHLSLKREKGPETGPPFFSMILTFFKYLRAHDWKCRESLARLKKSKILIICLENPFREIYSKKILSKCFSWFPIFVCIGAAVFFRVFFFLLSSVSRISRSLHTCLRLTKKRWKIGPVLQIQASSMKLRVHGFLFLVFLHFKTDGKNKLFLITTSTFRYGGFSRR